MCTLASNAALAVHMSEVNDLEISEKLIVPRKFGYSMVCVTLNNQQQPMISPHGRIALLSL